MGKKILSIAIIAAAIVVIVFSVVNAMNKKERRENADQAADFTLETLDGTKVSLSDYKGKKVILNFWTTWCPPCKAEMPHMQNFHEKHEDSDVALLAVNLTTSDSIRDVENFIDGYGLTFPVLLDVDGEVGELYEIIPIPTTYFLDEEGNIMEKFIGTLDEEMIENILDSY
ncbi:redoxin domain-containing protein [Metasolibacillus meyeri]|uniref:Redoxin domain-containing protein n=1 Tax=Metasolibacillus meyeri TaxID=1071052 RepID=A0AAW9NW20_9BACL|nr:redoxin domain-containing protein [Metasolibacillus meyeri]MEC1180777.1 redoxin domain-containing protein [Metasolibacillus meyeri]